METTLFRAVALSVIRHALTAAGCAVVIEHNWGDIESLVGAAVAVVPVIWSAWRSRKIITESK